MTFPKKRFYLYSGLLILGFPNISLAQIIPDPSLGTQITPNLNIKATPSDRIDAGAIRGSNLFHSFSEFNINTGRGVYFTNPTNITNIFTRVTGENPSNINGTLGVLGDANLFLINPNGIIFGNTAKLDVNGSFLGTTASTISFSDGSVFCKDQTCLVSPLLTQTVPVGLGFGTNKPITVQGNGHNITVRDILFSPYTSPSTATGLQVKPGKTLALVGGEVNLDGGVLTASGGRIEVGSVNMASQVGINFTNQGFALDYTNVPNLQNIQLAQRSLLNVSGSSAGSVQMQGNSIRLSDGSTLWSQNRGILPGGDINVRAAELLEIVRTSPDERVRSGIMSETLGTASNSNINVSTAKLILENGATIASKNFGRASGGSINVNATESIQMRGLSPNTNVYNVLGSITFFSSGTQAQPVLTAKAGDVSITTPNLSMQDASYISAISFGDSVGGNVSINTNTAELIGGAVNTPSGTLTTTISSVGYVRGDSGNIKLNTGRLKLQDGGMMTTTSLGTSNAGSILINASESVEVTGRMPETGSISNISSTIGSSSPAIQRLSLYRAIGNGGNISINTPSLVIKDGAGVSVQNYGVGDAGVIKVNADFVQLNNRARIGAATTNKGERGNIILQVSDLQMLNNSEIFTNAGGTGNGGNITIDADTIVKLGNSNINANALQGKGGNINISSQGIFSSPDSLITATGTVNGDITIITPDIKQDNSLKPQTSEFINTEKVMASSCLAHNNSLQGTFVVTGSGGLQKTPSDDLELPFSISQIRPVNLPIANIPLSKKSHPTWKLGDQIQEATQLSITTDGRLLLDTPSRKQASSETLTC